ncbi:MAG: phosphodiesterase [Acidimicrobiales bacterium]
MLVAQLSDPHIVEEGQRLLGDVDSARCLGEAVDHVNGLDPQPDLVLLTGDLVNEGTPAQYAHLNKLLEPLRARFHLVPGNHDLTDELRAAFPDHVHGEPGGRADGVIEGPLRVVTLDSSRYPEPGGSLDAAQLSWLDQTLAAAPGAPTVVAVHHPPFATGIEHMDAMGLDPASAAGLAAVIATHPQVERVLSGHLHRSITRRFAGTIALTAPGTAHAVQLDLGDHPAAWNHEPPAILLHLLMPTGGVVTHLEVIGDHGPVPFGS